MNFKRFTLPAIVLSSLTALVACGGSSSSISPETAASAMTSKLSSTLAALNLGTGLNSSLMLELLDSNYLDGGANQASSRAVVDATAAAIATTPDLSLFPSAEVTNARVTDCDSNNICNMTATLTNQDTEDTVAVEFTTKVKIMGSAVYLYGDQTATAPI